MSKAKVAIIMGSESDLKVMQGAEKALAELGINYRTEIISAHRTPEKMIRFAKSAHRAGFQVIIAGAGGAAHLPGMVASATHLPVIGVPVNIGGFDGIDSFLSIAQMPKGVPVATVAIDNAFNAGLLAARILAIQSKGLTKKLQEVQKAQKTKVRQMNKRVKARE